MSRDFERPRSSGQAAGTVCSGESTVDGVDSVEERC